MGSRLEESSFESFWIVSALFGIFAASDDDNSAIFFTCSFIGAWYFSQAFVLSSLTWFFDFDSKRFNSSSVASAESMIHARIFFIQSCSLSHSSRSGVLYLS